MPRSTHKCLNIYYPSINCIILIEGVMNRIIHNWASEASPTLGCSIVIGERSEPLSRVFNDQPSGIYIWWNPYVRTFLIRMRMYA